MRTIRGLPLLAAALIGCGGSTGTADIPTASMEASENACTVHRPTCYSIADIGPVIDDWFENTSLGVNSHGVVVGTTPRWSTDPDPRRAFSFKHGTVSPLLGLGGGTSEARAVNEWGLAVGGSLDPEGHYRATSYFNGVVTDLGTLDGTNSWSWQVNDFGFAVGNGYVSGVAHAAGFFLGKVIDLGSIGGPTYANDVNDLFEVVGTGQLADGAWSGFVRHGSKLVPFGAFGIPTPSTARAINNRGTACGSWTTADGSYFRRAFLLHRDGSVVDLPDLGYTYSYCEDVNDQGVAVGFSDDGQGSWRAVTWTSASEPPIDLNPRLVPARPDVFLYAASKISASGNITVYGWSFTDAAVEGYLLTPTACPE